MKKLHILVILMLSLVAPCFSFCRPPRLPMMRYSSLFSSETEFDERPKVETSRSTEEALKEGMKRAIEFRTRKPWFKRTEIKIIGNSAMIIGLMAIPLAAYCELPLSWTTQGRKNELIRVFRVRNHSARKTIISSEWAILKSCIVSLCPTRAQEVQSCTSLAYRIYFQSQMLLENILIFCEDYLWSGWWTRRFTCIYHVHLTRNCDVNRNARKENETTD